ncbi:hypothetical protein [Paenibacillus sp. 1781tsa1]|uniref:hypothetical protein n=1 Tax=Paenibacillus sp. 1781tsa1 TaxID=2953810 RepID=UPI0020A1EE7B|nr:hypothetical protein [Paenibacillus sp. 1781tsa1]MCP1184933.1 hypothetical protein [Paenibacillus sp. 1781tsa1]
MKNPFNKNSEGKYVVDIHTFQALNNYLYCPFPEDRDREKLINAHRYYMQMQNDYPEHETVPLILRNFGGEVIIELHMNGYVLDVWGNR